MEKFIYTTKLSVDRWKEYKKLKIEAISNEKTAFSFEINDLLLIQDEDWKKDLENSIKGINILMFVQDGDILVGMGQIVDYKGDMYKHNVSLGMLYVTPSYRGLGIGTELIKRRIEIIEKRGEIKNILCEIFSSQKVSIEIHKKLGFEVLGKMKDYVCLGSEYYDSVFMQKQLY